MEALGHGESKVFLPVGEFCSKTFEESLTRAFLGSLWGAS
jgi:hypothetical protein